MDLDVIRQINATYVSGDSMKRAKIMRRIGDPTGEEIVARAHEGLQDEDRNVRVQMVRLLSRQTGEKAAEGMLKALGDPARRIRKLALQSSSRFAQYSSIEEKLREIMEDENEVHWLRSSAFSALFAGQFRTSLAHSVNAARSFFGDLPNLKKYRQQAMDILVRIDPLTDAAENVLRQVVDTGSKEEAVAATRALCGYKVISLGQIADVQERRRIATTCEPAGGRVFFWVPRE
jgi:hypothetical protein